MKKRHRWILMLLTLCSAALLTGSVAERRELAVEARVDALQEDLAGEVFRFHVIANSDSDQDQALKYQVRDRVIAYMRRCPSLSKVVDNDAGPCLKYCFHCAGWILPLMTKCGYFCVFDLIDPTRPECSYSIFPTAEAAKAHREKLIAAGHKPEYIQTNIPGVE